MRVPAAFASVLLFLLAACSSSNQPEPPSGGTIPTDIDFGKLVGGQGGGTQDSKGGAPQGGYYRVKLTKVMDTQGWEQPVEIARFLIPSDWRGEGGAQWDQKSIQCIPNIVKPYYLSQSPDGLSGMEIGAPSTWVSSDNREVLQMLQQAAAQGGCPVNPAMTALEYLERTVVAKFRPGATVLDRQPEPEVAQAKRTAAAASFEPLRAAGALRDYRLDSGSIHIAYRKNGQPVEEWISTTLVHLATPTSSVSGLSRGVLNDATQITSMAENVIAIRAPQGKFDKELAATIVASIRPNPAYQAAVAKFQQNMSNIALRGAMDRARIWREAQAEISATITETYRNQQATQDRAAERFSRYIRGVEAYNNPSTGERVELTGGYENAWANGSGEYVLSNVPGFEPGQVFTGDWVRLNPVN